MGTEIIKNYGSGSGYSSGYGYGDGSGDGSGLLTINDCKVYRIDGVQTIIHSIKGSVARCEIINKDLTLSDCYVVRVGDSFAHGETIKKAQSDAEAKHLQSQPIDERIRMFHEAFGGVDKIPASDLFDWHFKLTGSCENARSRRRIWTSMRSTRRGT